MKIKNIFQNIFHNFFRGLHSADNLIINSTKEILPSSNIEINQQNEENSLFKSLLKGEITQEVKEMRYETYKICEASKKYGYAGNGNGYEKKFWDEDEPVYDKRDGLKAFIIQENKQVTKGLTETLSTGDIENKIDKKYTLNIERDFLPKFRIEEVTSKIVVKQLNDTKYSIEFYLPLYSQQFNQRYNIILGEINRLYEKKIFKSDIIDGLNNISFITNKAYGIEDAKLFKFNDITYQDCYIFDGHYILKFESQIEINGEYIFDKFYNKESEEKYKKKEPRKKDIGNLLDYMDKPTDSIKIEDQINIYNTFKKKKPIK